MDDLNDKIRRAEEALRTSIQKYGALQGQAQALQQAQRIAEQEVIAAQALLAGLRIAGNQDPGADSLPPQILQAMRPPASALVPAPPTPPSPFEGTPTP